MSIKSLFKSFCVTYLAAIAVSSFMVTSNANASYIIDTGSATGTLSFGVDDSSIAGQFTLTDSYIIDSIEGWFAAPGGAIRTATAAIYTDSAAFPGSELFSQQFTVDTPSSDVHAWDGAYDLSWALDPGTYWLVFEQREGDNANNVRMPYEGTPNPLDKYAYYLDANGYWLETPASVEDGFGMRISAVPVPAAVWLFGSGLIGLIGIARRKKA